MNTHQSIAIPLNLPHPPLTICARPDRSSPSAMVTGNLYRDGETAWRAAVMGGASARRGVLKKITWQK